MTRISRILADLVYIFGRTTELTPNRPPK